MSLSRVALVGGTVFDGTGAPPLADTTVLVEGASIVSVGPRATTSVPADATVLDATGHTVLPGLIEMHTHTFSAWDKALMPRRGITTARYAGGYHQPVVDLRERIRAGDLLGPRLFSVGPTIDRPPTARPQDALVVDSVDTLRREVRRLLEQEQVDALFAARRIDAEMLRVMLDLAHAAGKPVTGQPYTLSGRQAALVGIDGLENTARIPESPALDDATIQDYRSVSHRLGMLGTLWATAPDGLMQEVLGTMAERQVEWAPGIVTFEHTLRLWDSLILDDADYPAAPQDLKDEYWDHVRFLSGEWDDDLRATWRHAVDQMKRWVGYYHQIGGPVVVGTDTHLGAITYHRELQNLRESGLSNAEVLVAATSRAGRALRHAYLGVVATGALADLIVVDGDPLADLGMLASPVHVLVDGQPVVVDRQPRRPIPA